MAPDESSTLSTELLVASAEAHLVSFCLEGTRQERVTCAACSPAFCTCPSQGQRMIALFEPATEQAK